MNIPDIIKSFQYFYENILPKALSSPDINEESIANAFLWAEFCEKLYGRLDEETIKKLKDTFDANAAKFQDENLKQCTSVLCHAFLQNPSIDRNSLKSIVSGIKPSDFNLNEIWEDAVELDSLCVNLIESLKPVSLKESNRSLYYEVKSELLVDFLKELSDQLRTEGQTETYFNLIFETLCDNEDSKMVLLNVLAHNASPIHSLAVHWVLLKLLADEKCPLARFLWRRPSSELRVVAANHPAFFSYYLDFLTKAANKSTMSESSLSYDEVLLHFEALTSIQDDVATATLAHLRTLAGTGTEIWKDVLSAVT